MAGQTTPERQPVLCPGDLALNLPTPGHVTLAKFPSFSEPVSSSVNGPSNGCLRVNEHRRGLAPTL